MVESMKKETELKPAKTNSYKGLVLGVVLLAFCGAGAYLWQKNPDFADIFKSEERESALVENLQSQIDALSLKVQTLEKAANEQVKFNDLSMLNDKVNTSLKFNDQILNSKADVNSVLGVINRVDDLEVKVKNLGQVSSQGALVLTASMLVKDSAYKGSFVYEAEVLRHLAYGTAMQTPAEEIYQLSENKILCSRKLKETFNLLYADMQKADVKEDVKETKEDADWKEKITSKLNELVVIEKHEEKTAPENVALDEDEVYKLVNDGYFALAVEKMKQNELYNTDKFKVWADQVSNKEKFEQALKQIEALTLAFMKAESLHGAQ